MVVGMLRKAAKHVKATDLCFMMDTYTEPCWRLAYHPGYKGGRDREGLQPRQISPILRPRLERRGIPVGYIGGMEADDLLRAMAYRVRPETQLYIYTKDNDLFAGLNEAQPNVRVLWPGKDGLEVFGHTEAELRLGYTPALLPQVRALVADTKDNIRGMFGDPPPQRVPINTPRAVALLQLHNRTIWDMVDAARNADARPERLEGWREKEVAWVRQHSEVIPVAWTLCAQRYDAFPKLDAAACDIRRMDLTLPDHREQ
jgi:5'-3' exonuclease